MTTQPQPIPQQQEPDEDLYKQAVECVRKRGKASKSLLQRHLLIGSTRAQHLIDVMEARGVIGPMRPADNNGWRKQRYVLPETDDTLYGDAVKLVRQLNSVSVAILQHHFSIDELRAVFLINVMEARGVVGIPRHDRDTRYVLPQTDDILYEDTVALVRRLGRASTALLRRELRIGYTRAKRLIDVMEARGVIGPMKGYSMMPRDVFPETKHDYGNQ